MNGKKVLEKIKNIMIEQAGEDIVSLYVMGSFMTKDVEKTSDIDIIAIMKDDFDFRKEISINSLLNRKLKTKYQVSLGTMSIKEFYRGRRKGSLTKHTGLPIFLNFLKHAKLIHGKRLAPDKFPVKPASLKMQMNYHCNLILTYGKHFRKIDKIGVDWTFRDFIKTSFYIADLELQITRKTKPKPRYADIVNAFKAKKYHIIHETMRLRKKKFITSKEKQEWISKAEDYAKEMKKLCK